MSRDKIVFIFNVADHVLQLYARSGPFLNTSTNYSINRIQKLHFPNSGWALDKHFSFSKWALFRIRFPHIYPSYGTLLTVKCTNTATNNLKLWFRITCLRSQRSYCSPLPFHNRRFRPWQYHLIQGRRSTWLRSVVTIWSDLWTILQHCTWLWITNTSETFKFSTVETTYC